MPHATDATVASSVELDATLAPAGLAPCELATLDPLRYAVGDEIARGRMGRITAARDRRLGRPVAIKELLIESSDQHELQRQACPPATSATPETLTSSK